jgi:hypothetical protein
MMIFLIFFFKTKKVADLHAVNELRDGFEQQLAVILQSCGLSMKQIILDRKQKIISSSCLDI